MRTFSELTEDEQQQAINQCRDEFLTAIVEGAIRFNDEENGDDLQARIDAAGQKSEEMHTPWFAAEYIYEAAQDEIDATARADAEDAVYPSPDERVVILKS